MADKNAPYCIKLLHYHGFITRTDITSQFVGHDKKDDVGRVDVFAARNGKAVGIEIKRGPKHAFDLTQWRQPQRDYAAFSTREPFNIPWYMYLTIGQHPPHYNEESYIPRCSWLVPYAAWVEMDRTVREYQNALVIRARAGMNKKIQSLKLDAKTLLEPYELLWRPQNSLEKPAWLNYNRPDDAPEDYTPMYGGFWIVPKRHVFYEEFIKETTPSVGDPIIPLTVAHVEKIVKRNLKQDSDESLPKKPFRQTRTKRRY